MQRRYTRTFVLLAGIAITTASGVGAQSSAIVQTAAAPVAAGRVPTNAAVVGAPLAGPRMQPVALLRTSVVDSVAPLPLPRDPGENVGQNLAMMGVGAAGLAAGLLIGGDGGNAIAIVGAVVGLLGLYRYMR